MSTKLTSKDQVTIAKHIRDARNLAPGAAVDFAVNTLGQVVLHPATARSANKTVERFATVRGKATVKWRTDELMKLLRSES